MSEQKFDILPKLEDLVASGICAASAMMWSGQGSPQTNALEQLGAQIGGRVLAQYFDVTNNLAQTPDPEGGVRLQEKDVMTGAVRAGVSLAQNRANRRVGMDGLRGIACAVLGRMVSKQLEKE